MKRFIRWLRVNLDAVVVMIVALTAAAVEMFGTFGGDDKYVPSATLVVLALLAISILRDRAALSRAVRDTATVRQLYGAEIGQTHALARGATDQWAFKGGTGSYLRAVTLPELLDKARHERRSLRVQLEILDPANEAVCRDDAHFRASLQPANTGRPWTADRVRKQAYGTVLAAWWYHQQSEFLEIDLAVSPIRTTYRWDLSAGCVIVTQGNANTPALLFESDKPHYRDLARELRMSFRQAKRVPIDLHSDLSTPGEPTLRQTRELFDRLGMPLPGVYTDDDVAEIIRHALRPEAAPHW
ncbi:hypothetical protein [Nocardia sp. NPDC005978]|uniref:hypothetical protein n=1 Tax=unclassified Nocardia TaxID=2637762 RepID=UPI00339EFB1A